MSLIFKLASEPFEFEQIEKLNYQTFVEEIPQHEKNQAGMLRDQFHDENTYIIGLKEKQLVGMICVRSNRPFSLDRKIGEVEQHLPVQVNRPCEIRLLAVDPAYRNGRVFMGLTQGLIRYCLKMGYDAALISGTTREQKLYKQLGFQPFAYLTGDAQAAFQPMYLTKAIFDATLAGRILKEPVNFLPGPVSISENVRDAFMNNPYSHRSKAFADRLLEVQTKLKTMVNARFVQVFHGTGTLANDVVAGQLSVVGGKGLILVNGEFGMRLVDHAERWGLDFDQLKSQWGDPFQYEQIEQRVKDGKYQWIWAVHSETSTGILNDIDQLKDICQNRNLQLCLDCVSSLGAVPIDLNGVAYASGVSGKSLGSYTGLSFVFHQNEAKTNSNLPRYLDLGAYFEADGIPYSQSSNLVDALHAALIKYDPPEIIYDAIKDRYELIREGIEKLGFHILSDEANSSPVIMTIGLRENYNSRKIGDDLFLNGINVHYESSYLQKRNWLQISCINSISVKDIERMLRALGKICYKGTLDAVK
ncbi:aminotransferase class V-fold PLP-dependent enzyme [Bacillus niameyensis]|uniref:aminotransferase class V-fold PLP-dependent enzyme n=1 Tax=Bacillus niameyensis TaxID=1522308 RepID=UPI000782F601|nr:aminotransferase class V-fold PLP-dependent enzyme [Bacillus niameyensis]